MSTISKIQYISDHLKRIQHKHYELYVISALWNKLNDFDVKFVFQQCMYVDKDNKRALADLYLPQFNWIIEIDEAHHLRQEEEDKRRIDGIRSIVDPNIRVSRIPINIDGNNIRSDEDITKDIDNIVIDIRNAKQEALKAGSFIPWRGDEEELTADYHKHKKGFIDADSGDASLFNVSEVFALFFPRIKARNCTRYYPRGCHGTIIWCPKLTRDINWENEMKESGNDVLIYEKHKIDGIIAGDNKDHINDYRINSHTRVIFIKERTPLGVIHLRFVGVFNLDGQLSKENGHPVFKRIASVIKYDPKNVGQEWSW